MLHRQLIRVRCLLIALAALCAINTAHAGMRASYTVEFTDAMPPIAHVEIAFDAPVERVSMGILGAWELEGGWGEFVESLRAVDDAGHALPVAPAGRAEWSIGAPDESAGITLQYTVRYDEMLGRDDWPRGVRTTTAYCDGAALYLNLYSLLLIADGVDSATLSLVLPEGWSAATAWGSGNVFEFEGDRLESLHNNALVVGRFARHAFEASGFEATIAALDGWASDNADLIAQVATTLIAQHIAALDWRAGGSLLVVAFEQASESGEAYRDGYTLVGPDPLTAEALPIWGNSIGHELFHYFNGQRLRTEPWAGMQWFNEGFTEHYANLAMVRSGLVDERVYLAMLERHIVKYAMFKRGAPFEAVSLVRAGDNKGLNAPALYDGGALVAFCLDVRIREATNNERSLDDLMRACIAESMASGPLTIDEIAKVGEAATGVPMREFLARYVEGLEPLPIEESLHKAGFACAVAAQSAHIRIDNDAPPAAAAIRNSILLGSD